MEMINAKQCVGCLTTKTAYQTTQISLVKLASLSRSGAILAAMLSFFLSLCGCSTAIHKEFSIGNGSDTALSVDARQRFAFVKHRAVSEKDRQVICAEPSPDVFSVVAASTSGGIGFAGKKLEIASSVAQSAAALGPRSQTIQLLRDGLYRACEAYMNGALDEKAYRQILHGYDEVVITLVAIDGLTAMQPGQLPMLNGQTNSKPAIPPETGPATNKAAKNTKTDSANTKPPNPTTSESISAKFNTSSKFASDGKKNSSTVSTGSPSMTVANNKPADANVSEHVHQMVHDYYCFQLILKKAFYPDAFKDIPISFIYKICSLPLP